MLSPDELQRYEGKACLVPSPTNPKDKRLGISEKADVLLSFDGPEEQFFLLHYKASDVYQCLDADTVIKSIIDNEKGA